MVRENDAMRMGEWFQEKWINRVRQFGILASLIRIFKIVIKPIYRNSCYFILAIRNHRPDSYMVDSDIHFMTAEWIESIIKQETITKEHKFNLKKFLSQGCQGFMAEIDGRFAGYVFNQPAGECSFGYKGRFRIPPEMMLLRWLFVFSEFRGHSLGKKFVQAMIAATPADMIPITFVKADNRFALRNNKMYGFEEMLRATRTTWFGRWSTQKFEVLCDSEISRRLINGFHPKELNKKVGA
jgi:GNAT superfamily N-acetyltransferase